MSTHEKNTSRPEHQWNNEAIEHAGDLKREELRQNHEKAQETHEDLKDVRHEALEKAMNLAHETNKEKDNNPEVSRTEKRTTGMITKSDREDSFRRAMDDVQNQMSKPSRTFSRIIHNETVERISDTAANTIARPNSLLLGAVLAFFLTLGVFLLAKNLGYPLSGFETTGAFILGWVIGLTYDFLRAMITGRSN